MRVIYRVVIIGIFIAMTVGAVALLPGIENRAQATPAGTTIQPNPNSGALPMNAERLLGLPNEAAYSRRGSIGLAQRCIPRGQACVINGTPCCAGSCQGKFPNTSCR